MASITTCEKNLRSFLEFREQAVRDKASEVPNNDRVERLINELTEAPGIIERLPQERREELINRLREVQMIPASEASQAEAAHQVAPRRMANRMQPGEAYQVKTGPSVHLWSKHKMKEKSRETAVAVRWKSTKK